MTLLGWNIDLFEFSDCWQLFLYNTSKQMPLREDSQIDFFPLDVWGEGVSPCDVSVTPKI